MAQNLREGGPLVLGSLMETDLLRMVDLLISDKKWVEENPTQTPPFKVIQSVERASSGRPLLSNGLSSIFLGPQPESNIQRQLDRSRSEVLADCQKLVDEILKEYPEGFDMGGFRKLFLERYGYFLDVRKLGYQRLESLLHIMPGLKIESTYIVPSWTAPKGSLSERSDTNGLENNGSSGKVANSNSELSDSSRKEDDLDAIWDEELGPVANTNSNRNEMGSEIRKNEEETEKQEHLAYEPVLLSDDDLSESEGEASLATGIDKQEMPKANKEDSSLIRILDSWYGNKENKRRDVVEHADGMIDCSSKDSKSGPGSSEIFSEDDTPPITYRKKQRSVRSYSFVSDSGDKPDKLVNGIIDSLKKSGETKMHS